MIANQSTGADAKKLRLNSFEPQNLKEYSLKLFTQMTFQPV
jgi:hypothetical protein